MADAHRSPADHSVEIMVRDERVGETRKPLDSMWVSEPFALSSLFQDDSELKVKGSREGGSGRKGIT